MESGRQACGYGGFRRAHPDLRHTYASIAIANGCDVKTLQSQLGHSSAMVTLDTYARLWPEKLDEVADAVGRARAEELDEAA